MLESIDIRDAYLHVPIFPRLPETFKVRSGTEPLSVRGLGLATAPPVCTKVLAPPLAILGAQGIKIMAYLDDLLLVDQSIASLNQTVCNTVEYLESLGWILEKNWPCNQ